LVNNPQAATTLSARAASTWAGKRFDANNAAATGIGHGAGFICRSVRVSDAIQILRAA
jgi:hypothetical protein